MTVPSLVPLSVAPIPGLADDINDIRMKTSKIVGEHIIPAEDRLSVPGDERDSLIYELQSHVKESSLWAPHLPTEYGGMGIGFLGHAYMNEILAWSPFSNTIFGVQAPTSGNQVGGKPACCKRISDAAFPPTWFTTATSGVESGTINVSSSAWFMKTYLAGLPETI